MHLQELVRITKNINSLILPTLETLLPMESACSIQSSTTKSLTKKSGSWESNLPSFFILIAMLKLKINSENAAFDQEGQEVARILRGLADQVEHLDKLQECQLPLRDLNGNTVGYYQTWTDQGKSQGAVISSPYATWTQNQFPN